MMDSSFSVNAGAMIEAKDTRKRAENDLQLVANRIALLRYEEQVWDDRLPILQTILTMIVNLCPIESIRKSHRNKGQSTRNIRVSIYVFVSFDVLCCVW